MIKKKLFIYLFYVAIPDLINERVVSTDKTQYQKTCIKSTYCWLRNGNTIKNY